MRDSAVFGPALRKAHRQAGATEYLTSLLGLEERRISHVLGHSTTGYQLQHERQTTIVTLMRAGEPMASGVSDVFPLAMFVHARRPEDIYVNVHITTGTRWGHNRTQGRNSKCDLTKVSKLKRRRRSVALRRVVDLLASAKTMLRENSPHGFRCETTTQPGGG